MVPEGQLIDSIEERKAEIAKPRKPGVRQRARLVLVSVALGMSMMLALVLASRLPPWLLRESIIGFLWAVMLAELAGLVLIPVATAGLGVLLVRARRKGVAKPWAGRLLILAVSTLNALAGAEAIAAWLVSARGIPKLPASFPDDQNRNAAKELRIAVIGESSALGVPYRDWLSVPTIVAWQLERVFPDRKVSVEMLALGGANLAQAHDRLARLKRRPDAILVFSGHNEYQILVTWDRYVPYYVDDNPPGFWDRLEELGRSTSLGTLALEEIAKQRVNRRPPPRITRDMIDVPGFTPRESARLLDEYEHRLDTIAAYARSLGSLPILIVPAGNEADYEPNRSMLRPQTQKAEREEFRRRFLEARRGETADPARAIAIYQELIENEPGFAEAHFRLARLLARSGNTAPARRHFSLAQDLDGMPQRCLSSFQEACRAAGRRHDCVLVDSPEILGTLVPDGILDDRLFHDAHHLTLVGYIALSQEVLRQLHQRRAFGWPEGTGVPLIDVDECAEHFGIGQAQWAEVCRKSSAWYDIDAYIRFDPSARLNKAILLEKAQHEIEQGTAPEAAGVPGYGRHPRLDGPPVQSGEG